MTHCKKNIDKEIKYDNIQIIVSFFSILVILISIMLLYNERLCLEKKKPLFNSKQAKNISLFNRFLALVTLLIFLYVNYNLYVISKEENDNIESSKLQVTASVFTVIASLIVLYVVFNSKEENLSDVENPII